MHQAATLCALLVAAAAHAVCAMAPGPSDTTTPFSFESTRQAMSPPSFALPHLSLQHVRGRRRALRSARSQLQSMATWANLAWEVKGDRAEGRDVVLVDMFDTSEGEIKDHKAAGRLVLCYINAGTTEKWRSDAVEFKSVMGPRYNNEENWILLPRWREAVWGMNKRLQQARDKGCQGVELDNLDCYQGSRCIKGAKDSADREDPETLKKQQLQYAGWLSDTVHKYGMVAGFKNAVDLIERMEPMFDFAVNESCQRFDECYYYAPFRDSNKPIFAVEYIYKPGMCGRASEYGMSLKYKRNGWHDCLISEEAEAIAEKKHKKE